ncbi:hypothetical protein ACTQ50_03860, partial [Blautia sp. Sow4_E7]
LFGKLANKNGVKYSHVWHPSAGCQISVMGYTLKLCAYVRHDKDGKKYLYDFLEIKKETSSPLESKLYGETPFLLSK